MLSCCAQHGSLPQVGKVAHHYSAPVPASDGPLRTHLGVGIGAVDVALAPRNLGGAAGHLFSGIARRVLARGQVGGLLQEQLQGGRGVREARYNRSRLAQGTSK